MEMSLDPGPWIIASGHWLCFPWPWLHLSRPFPLRGTEMPPSSPGHQLSSPAACTCLTQKPQQQPRHGASPAWLAAQCALLIPGLLMRPPLWTPHRLQVEEGSVTPGNIEALFPKTEGTDAGENQAWSGVPRRLVPSPGGLAHIAPWDVLKVSLKEYPGSQEPC